MFYGLDVHKQFIQVCELDHKGANQKEALPGFGWVPDGAESGRDSVRTGLKKGLVVRGEAAISCRDAA